MRQNPFVGCRRLCTVVALGVSISNALGAQTGVVRGRVTDVGSGRPIAEAQVSVTGTPAGALTNSAGEYLMRNVPAGAHEVVARRLGYARRPVTVTVPAGGEVRADFAMSQAVSQLEAIVVTGTAGAAEKRTLGNAITQIDAADVVSKSTLGTVSELLQAKAQGLLSKVSRGVDQHSTAAMFDDDRNSETFVARIV